MGFVTIDACELLAGSADYLGQQVR